MRSVEQERVGMLCDGNCADSFVPSWPVASQMSASEPWGCPLLLLSKRKEIADFMAAQRIPAIYPFREYAGVGGLFVYGANISVLFERAAEYLDRLLKGEKVGNLPVQQATAFELIVNTRTASALGLTVPPSVLLRADEVIE